MAGCMPRPQKSTSVAACPIPVSSLKPTATWVTGGQPERQTEDDDHQLDHLHIQQLQCRVAVTLEADTVTLDAFEATIANGITRAHDSGYRNLDDLW